MPDDNDPTGDQVPQQDAVPETYDERRAGAYDAAAAPHGADPVTGEVLGDATPRKTFASFVIEQRNGALHAEASETLAELVRAVQDHGKAGTVQITIRIAPGSKGTNTLVVSDDVKIKAPQGDRPAALFFPDDDGNLHRSDPRQLQHPALRRVDVPPAGPLRRPGGDT